MFQGSQEVELLVLHYVQYTSKLQMPCNQLKAILAQALSLAVVLAPKGSHMPLCLSS